ncbi:hypothetical protein KR52_07260 [Synechococcus sp. KORDI-52]|nr:hypothetical protein KR52_07260 [Synechococcus sp. KORDI-52]
MIELHGQPWSTTPELIGDNWIMLMDDLIQGLTPIQIQTVRDVLRSLRKHLVSPMLVGDLITTTTRGSSQKRSDLQS